MNMQEQNANHPSTALRDDTDYFFYAGEINRSGYKQISKTLEQKSGSESLILALITPGGDPSAGYRMSRAFGHYYKNFAILVPDICKSAGTLMCLGAERLIVSDRGELGPLDVQLRKQDEMFEIGSSLDILQAMSTMRTHMVETFLKSLVDIKLSSEITTKLSADIATKLTSGFIGPIMSQIDPIKLGEHERAMRIAMGYGKRLAAKFQNPKPDAISTLLSTYPEHGFVIDRKECTELFHRVTAPSRPDEIVLDGLCRSLLGDNAEAIAHNSKPHIVNIKELIQTPSPNQEVHNEQANGNDSQPSHGTEGEQPEA